jgi:hypothetical protein
MGGSGRSAMCVKMVCVKMVPIRTVTGMGLGCDRRELNGDQQDRRSKNPQECAGRNHRALLPYGSSEGNKG